MSCFKIYHLPILICVWFLTTFIITYFMSVLGGHVYAFFPYISDSGALPPESCIFAQMMNLGSVIMGITMYLRFLQFKKYMEHGYINIDRRWNKLSLICGGLACLGVSIVGNFQETNALVVHLFGATLIISFGILYFLIQMRLGYESVKLHKKDGTHGISVRMFNFRIFMICTIIIFQWILVPAALISFCQFTGTSIQWWTEKEGAFDLRLVATFSEWILFILMFVFIATFTGEFKLIKFEETRITVRDISDWEPSSTNQTVQISDMYKNIS